MTEAGWTRGRPTKPGWYWWRDCDCPSDPIIVRVVHDGYGLIVYGLEEYSRRLYETRGEWLGPISPDDRQQGRVEGLRKAAIICRERGKPHDIEWWMTASKKEVSAQTAIDCAELIEKLAQAAQEGGAGDAKK